MQHQPKLTDYELEALRSGFDLAVAHARYSCASSSTRALRRVEEYMLSPSSGDNQEILEREFKDAFFALARQESMESIERTLYCSSASISIEIVANYLRLNRLSVGLIEPAFDNLADILKRQCVPLQVMSEDCLRERGVETWLRQLSADAIFMVCPNNPTGYLVASEDMHALVEFCVTHDKLLILDFSLRFSAPDLFEWDQYAFLNASGVRYVVIEDTGKTWSTIEVKVSMLLADETTFASLRSIYRDMFLCLSPLNLMFLSEFINATLSDGLERTVWNLQAANRKSLRDVIDSAPLRPLSLPNIGVEWLRIENEVEDVEFMMRLATHGIRIIPGRYFFWSNPGAHTHFARIALTRDVDMFGAAMRVLQEALPIIFPA